MRTSVLYARVNPQPEYQIFLGSQPSHPCTGGTFEAEGNIIVVMQSTGGGYFLLIGPCNGVTMTDVDMGELYYFVGGLNSHSVDASGGTYVHHLNWISSDSGVNFVGQILEHVTITPDGDITVTFESGGQEIDGVLEKPDTDRMTGRSETIWSEGYRKNTRNSRKSCETGKKVGASQKEIN